MVLGQTELLKGCTSGNLDLRRNNIDTGDFLGDCVLYLNTRIDLYEVVVVPVEVVLLKICARSLGGDTYFWSTRNSAVPALR